MKDRNISLQEACDYIGVRCRQLMDDYLVARDELRETVGGDASRFIDALGSWIVGNMVYVIFSLSPSLKGYLRDSSSGGALHLLVTSATNMTRSNAP
jgi:hypothetical protein